MNRITLQKMETYKGIVKMLTLKKINQYYYKDIQIIFVSVV